MLLSARFLSQVASVNSWNYTDSAQWTQGDTVTVYLQLVDMTQDKAVQGFVPAGRRYVPATGATLSVTLVNVNQAVQITRLATQPYTSDGSIWKFTVLASDAISGTCDVKLSLNENGTITSGVAKAGALINGQ